MRRTNMNQVASRTSLVTDGRKNALLDRMTSRKDAATSGDFGCRQSAHKKVIQGLAPAYVNCVCLYEDK